jgi:hypothetical protein
MRNALLSFLPVEVEGFDSLAELALDLRWSWNHAADEVWRQLDPTLWDLTHNPWVILQTVSRDRLKRLIVELYADGWDGDAPGRQEMVRGEPLVGAVHGSLYGAQVPATRPAGDYTPRMVPHHPTAAVPLEATQISRPR